MKKILIFLAVLCTTNYLAAQTGNVGIGTATPASSAQLDITSTTKGLLIPRMTADQRKAISSPSNGLMVYETTSNSFWYYNGTAWKEIGAGESSPPAAAVGDIWLASGNNIYNTNTGNTGIGTSDPENKLQVHGNMVITSPTSGTLTPPTAAQTQTMINGVLNSFASTDSTGKIYDPSGPGANYIPGLTADVFVNADVNSPGIEITTEELGLGSGDSLIIKESAAGNTLLAVGNGYNSTGKWIFNSNTLYITFKSNTDVNTGTGFTLVYRRLYNAAGTLPDRGGYAGNSFLFDVKTGALRAGKINNTPLKNYSTGLGYNTNPSGDYSTAIGFATSATGYISTAMGNSANAAGSGSIAMGSSTNALGGYSTAMGANTSATGNHSTAMGYSSNATGNLSTAIGGYTNATGTNSVAMGYAADAAALGSTALGSFTTAAGNYSTTMGLYNNATGAASTATGAYTMASGDYSFATGYATGARGNYTTVTGYGNTATGYASLVTGLYNDSIVSAQTSINTNSPLFIVGNGTNASTRSNAMVVRMNGIGLYTSNPGSKLDVNGDFSLRQGMLTLNNRGGTNNNLVPGAYSFVKIASATNNFTITGFQGGSDGRILTILNLTGFNMTIANLNGSSATDNRINTLTGANIVTNGNGTVTLQYSIADNRWIVIAVRD
ncbi:MAG: hypothetical protein JNM88_08400 [Chitinophagaceae bacterium]|nr:hypothetical protein [Chitinophagaceae bacterium]